MLKKIILVLCLLLGVSVGIGYYFWRQVVALPEWYQTSKKPDNLNSLDEGATNSKKIHKKIEGQIKRQLTGVKLPQNKGQEYGQDTEVNIKLARQDIASLISESLREKASNTSILKVAKNIHTDIKNNNLEIGAVIDTGKITNLSLTSEQRKTFEKITENLPQIKNRDIYIAIQGQPKAEGGKLVLDRDSKVKIGNLSFQLPEIAQKLGLSLPEIQQQLILDIEQIEVRDVQISDQGVNLKISSDLATP